MIAVIMVVLEMMVFHTLDGRDVHVNPAHIVSISDARDESNPDKWLIDKVHCIITLSNGKLLTVAESCDSVRQRLEEHQ